MKNNTNKVLILSPSHGIWGGGQIFIDQLCKYLRGEGVNTDIFTSEPCKYTCHTVEIPEISSKKFKRLIIAIYIAYNSRISGYTSVILNDLSSLWLAPVFKLFRYNTISLLHLYLQLKKDNVLGHSVFEYFILKISSLFCNRIYSVNKNNQLIFGQNKVIFIGNFVPEWFFKAPCLNTNKEYDFILVSRLAEQKNISLFIQLMKNLINVTKKQYSALIVGDGPEKENIQAMLENENLDSNVDFLFWTERNDLPNIYDKGKCFVISSKHEGFATTLLEAHARGLPAVVTKSSGFCAEFVLNYDRKTGLVFEPDYINDKNFLYEIEKLLLEHNDYFSSCIEKAKLFNEDNVLGPISNYIISEIKQDT